MAGFGKGIQYGWPTGGYHSGESHAEDLIPGMKYNGVAHGHLGQGSVVTSARNAGSSGAQFSGSEIGLNGYADALRGISDNNNAFNLSQVEMVNDFNAKEAQKNRDWQERMSNTAHQREVADLIAAGLNPILSAGGVGATTPSGAVASGQKAVADNTFGNGMISLMTSAINAQSAERVAQIHAASNAYAANVYASASRYGSDLNYQSQSAYQQTIRDTTWVNNLGRLIGALIPKTVSYKN